MNHFVPKIPCLGSTYNNLVEVPNHDPKKAPDSVLSAHNIGYSVKVTERLFRAKTEKKILSDLTAVFKPGLSAIMGPTGSGKSTFLDILADRKDPSGVTGLLLFGGKPLPKNYKCMVGYVVQSDVITGTLTVKENLHFSAALRLPTSVSPKERNSRVKSVISELGLEKCADTQVGDEFSRGVSGGERKRCNIGMELIISPRLLFLDEPTSGLDSNTAFTVIQILKRLSTRGCTIILSIHQPCYAIFAMFDNLLLMADGHVVYHGAPLESLEFFATLGYECQIYNNPADFVMDVIIGLQKAANGKQTEHDEHSQAVVSQQKLLTNGFKSSRWNKRLQDEADEIVQYFQASEVMNGTSDTSIDYATSFLHQVSVVMRRSVLNIVRNPATIIVTFGASLTFSALIIAIFWHMEDDPIFGFKDRCGLFLILIMNQLFFNMGAVELFIKERKLFMHEHSNGFYRASVYFTVKVFCDIISMRTIPLVIMGCLVYFSLGLKEGIDNFFIFMLSLFCMTVATAALCFLVSSSVQEFGTATTILSIACTVMFLFGGFVVSFRSIGPWLHWAQYLSYFKYALASLYITEFTDRVFCVKNSTICKTGESFLLQEEIRYQSPWDLWQNHVTLMAYTCLCLLLSYIQLRRLNTSG